MKYVSIEVTGHKRLRLNSIRRIKLTFTEIIQILLGSNGSGKSTLMRELSMLPAEPAQYEKWGSKHVTAEADDGQLYTASSVFEPHTKYRLVRHDQDGDVVVNDWGTATAQRAVVAELFKQTPEIRDLLLGKERFTQMGPGKRREWFMRLNNANYDYALEVFKKVNQEANDLASSLRTAKKRLVTEHEKIVKPEEEKKLFDEVNQIHRDLNILMENRAPVTKPSSAFEDQQKQQLADLEVLSRQLHRLRFMRPAGHYFHSKLPRHEWCDLTKPTFTSLNEVASEVERLKGEVSVRDALIGKAVKEHDRLKGELDILMKTGEAGLTELHKRFKAVHGRKIDFLATRTLVDVLPRLDSIHPINGMGALESVWDTLDDIASNIPDNSERSYSQVKLREIEEQIDLKTREQLRLNTALSKLHTRKEHADAHRGNGETTCPKCSYRWVIGYNESEYQRLLNGIAVYEEQSKQLGVEIKELQEQSERNREYGERYRSFIRLTQAWPVLDPLWDYLIEKEFIILKPRFMMGFVERFRHDLQIMKDALRLDAELGEISHLIDSAEKLGDASVTDVRVGLEQWTHEIEQLTSERHLLQLDVAEYQTYHRQLKEGQELEWRILQARSNVVQVNEEWIETLRRETILHCIRQYQTALSRKEEVLSYMSNQKAIVENLENEIRDMTIREEAARLVVRELSPTEGLIAEGLLGFIRHFVGQMNGIIKRIWSYPLVVQDCAVESHGGTELDYKFPVVVNDQEDPMDDVKDGSTGIMEIIDLAFRISAMQALGLGSSPLYLDEFGASFDKHHQTMATMTIANIMEERLFTQLFMVSHYEASYGAMANAEICILHSGNITVPENLPYNQHVELEQA